MSNLINVQDLTLSPEEVKDVAKVILERVFVKGALSDYHAIEQGIQHKSQIVFAGKIEDSLKKATGCVPNTGTGVTFSEKFWEPEIFDSRWEHCSAELNKLVKIFQKASKMNPDFYDRIDSQELGFVISLIEQMLNDSLPTKVWFSNKNAETYTDGGNFTNTIDLDKYNVINGLWVQIMSEINSGDFNYVSITQNAGASYSLQVLPADSAVDYLGKCFDQADSRLLQDPSAMFYVTRSIADNYRKTLRSKNLGAGFMEVVENGRPQLYFEGYKITVRDDWDRDIKALHDNGTKLDKPHRILFTTPENIPVGTLSTDDFTAFASFYDQYRKSNVIDVSLSLDTKFLENYMAVAAY